MQRPARLVLEAVLAAAIACSLPGPCAADPRWWWSDVRLTANPEASVTPHVVAPGYVPGGAGQGDLAFVTWSEVDPAGGDLEAWVTASFDGGCSWCAATRITDNAVDDTRPRIAVLRLPEGVWSFAVAFESAGQVVIAWESTAVSAVVPFAQQCAEMADLGPAIIAGDKYVRFGTPPFLADHPDIVSASTFGFGHFHAAWRDTRTGVSAIRYAHDLTARGLGWTMDPEKDLSALGPLPEGEDFAPVIAGDVTTDPDPISGLTTNDRSAPTVAFVHVSATDEVSIRALRSVDNGATFSPSGARADAPATPVSDPLPPRIELREPTIDSAPRFSTTDPSWVALAWDDGRGVVGPDLRADARFHATPTVHLPDWQSPDEAVTSRPSAADGDPSLCLQRMFGGPTPAWIAWEDGRFGTPDVAVRAGTVDESVPDAVSFAFHPYAPVRPLDPLGSTDGPLTHCAHDDATWDCLPVRAAGLAEDVELAGNEQAAFAVWSDTRDGNAEIYFKRTDRFVSAPTFRAAGECGPFGGAQVRVEIDQQVTCPTPRAGERMERFLLYHGTDPGGPFANAAAPVVVAHDPAAGPTVTALITGLLPGTTYQVLVVPEDEARNVSPPDFDPTRDLPAPIFRETAVLTPAPCAAPPVCLYRFDVTSLLPHVPARPAVYLVPRTAEDISLQGAPYACPFASGDLEPDPVAATNGVALALYQVNRPAGGLRVAREGDRLRFTF